MLRRIRQQYLYDLERPASYGCTHTGHVRGTRNRVSFGLIDEFRDAGRSRSRPLRGSPVGSGNSERTANIPTAMHRLLPRAVDNSLQTRPPSVPRVVVSVPEIDRSALRMSSDGRPALPALAALAFDRRALVRHLHELLEQRLPSKRRVARRGASPIVALASDTESDPGNVLEALFT